MGIKRGKVTAIMGGFGVDLREAELAPEGARIEVFVMMGGLEFKVPESWDVVLNVTPIMGGTEAYQRLRDIAPTLPIILMTGFGQDNIAGLIDADPHALFLPKPYALNRLARALRELLGE